MTWNKNVKKNGLARKKNDCLSFGVQTFNSIKDH